MERHPELVSGSLREQTMELKFITSNPGKLAEAQEALGKLGFTVVPHKADVTEIQADTLEEVARHKAEQLLHVVEPPYFLEDAGFSVAALQDFPGVYSHYVFDTLGHAGILQLLEHAPEHGRGAYFQAVIAYVDTNKEIHLFSGQVDGQVALLPMGTGGFGFDPIFVPDGETRTFAEMSSEEKSAISHRGRALYALHEYLSNA